MSAFLVLEDGSALYRPNLGYASMLHLIADEAGNLHPRLRVWLTDIAGRPSPFNEIDLRGLTEELRKEFWATAERAAARLIECYGPDVAEWPENSYGGESIMHLMRLHTSIESGEPPSALNDLDGVTAFDGKFADLEEIWGDTT